jgi:hypothetical protein
METSRAVSAGDIFGDGGPDLHFTICQQVRGVAARGLTL